MDFIILTPAILKKYYPLNTFQDEELNLIIRETRVENLEKRNIIFHQGSDDADVIYLISGSVKLKSDEDVYFVLDDESDHAIYPIANIKPRKFSAIVESETAAIAKIPTSHIASFLSKDQKDEFLSGNFYAMHGVTGVLDSDWIMAMKKTPLFQKLDEEYISQLFQVMEEKHYKSGDQVVKQGEQGRHFYLIKEGRCQVSRDDDAGETLLAELEPTDSFGEEALITHTRRNATVTMLQDGILMRISNEDFQRFMFQSVVHWVRLGEAVQLIKHGAVAIDVRKDSSNKKSFQNAIKAPL